MKTLQGLESALSSLPERIKRPLEFLPENIKESIEEIRLRGGLPLALTINGRVCFLRQDGTVCEYITNGLLTVSDKDLNEAFLKLCNNSVYAHENELKDGFLILKNGNRAGVCGNFSDAGAVRDISSLNIRIAHEVIGCADKLVAEYKGGGLLIAGPPGSGKTTLLRDFIRQVSSGAKGQLIKVGVIDSRGEISGSFSSHSANDLGVNTDVLMTYDKASGIEIAIRTLFPDIVAFDEIGNEDELKSVLQSFNAGVSVITTAHAGNTDELLKRSITKKLLLSGAINSVCMLSGKKKGLFETVAVSDLQDSLREKEYA